MPNTRKLTIYWVFNDSPTNNKIRERFGIPHTMTVNGETDAEIKEEDMPLLEETEKRGFIKIRYKPGNMPMNNAIKNLLCRILQEISRASVEVEKEDTDAGEIYVPNLRYLPCFEFLKEDVELIKWLADEEGEDFSNLTE